LSLYLDAARVDEDACAPNTLKNSREAISQAEKFAMTTLQTPRRMGNASEEITVYGIKPNSRYWTDVDVSDGKACVGVGAQQKCGIDLDIPRAFTDKYTGNSYDITFSEAVGNTTTMNVYLSLDDFNRLFDKDADNFTGYASNLPLALNGRYVATEITPDQMLSVAAQLQDSMGTMAQSLLYAVIPLFLILIYLLTKTVIDRSARSISYMKVFGYRNREISQLYIRSISATVLVSLVLCLPIIVSVIDVLVQIMMTQYSGNLEIWIAPQTYAIEVLIGAATYAVVALLHMRRIRKVPLALAMKVQE